MKLKQKMAFFIVSFGLTVGLVSAIAVATFPGSVVYAQVNPCSTDVIPEGMPQTRAACEEAVEAGKNPCTAIYNTLSADNNSSARDIRINCENAVGGPCSTEVLPANYSATRDACFKAVDTNQDPCTAIYNALNEANDDTAEMKRYNCQKATGTAPDCAPGEADCCGGVRTSIIKGDLCEGEGEEGGVIFGLLKNVLRILTAGVGIAAVGGIAYGALLYTTAENKPEQTKKAIGIITNVVIGIAAYALMYIFLNFLIPGGVFS